MLVYFQDLFTSSKFFFAMQIVQFIVYETLAYYILKYFGIGWIPFIVSMMFQATAQVRLQPRSLAQRLGVVPGAEVGRGPWD